MVMQWILALILIFQQVVLPDTLKIEQQGEQIEIVNRSELIYPLPGVPIINQDKVKSLMDHIDKRIGQPPVNASLDGSGHIIPERTGVKLDRLRFNEKVYGFIFEGELSVLEVPLITTYPKLDSELLSAIKSKRIGQYATYYNFNNKNRSHNIALAAKGINNHVVFPGERFSFNEIVGKRTKERGYMRAPVIVRGEIYEDVGGGICQVSSTLFNAADRAGLRIVKRYSHSRHVPYVPPGRDATVSWYGPDFVFQNDYNQPILIRSFAHAGQMSIAIYSSDVINDKPREVPSASKTLPEEINIEMDVNSR